MVYRSKKSKKRILEKKIKKAFFYFVIPIISLFIGTIFLINANFLSIKNISFIDNKNIDISILKEKIKSQLQEKYYGVYSKGNFLFYPEDILEDIVLSNKKVKKVDISYNGFKGDIDIEVEEKKPEFLYCIKDNKCFFMEGNGGIFTELTEEESVKDKKEYLVFYENVKTEKEYFLEEEYFYKVLNLVKSMKNIDLITKKVERMSQDQFVIVLKKGTKIIFSLEQDFLKITESLKKISSKKELKIDSFSGDFSPKILYINVSYGENIFYCFDGDICEGNY